MSDFPRPPSHAGTVWLVYEYSSTPDAEDELFVLAFATEAAAERHVSRMYMLWGDMPDLTLRYEIHEGKLWT